MRAVWLCLVLFLAGVAEGKDPELRIGVKKRPETCDMRTKAGDRLSMHYTVSLSQLNSKLVSSVFPLHFRGRWRTGPSLTAVCLAISRLSSPWALDRS